MTHKYCKLTNQEISISYGVNYSWGVFLKEYNKNVYPQQMTKLSWIGSICIAMFFILGPINDWVVRKLGYTKMLLIAAILCPLALMLASISHEIWHLYLTQGLMFGIGASFVWFPCISAPQQWFTKRRGLGVGVAMSGAGIGSLICSNITQAVISSLDYRWALRILGFICFVFLLLSAATIRTFAPNCEEASANGIKRKSMIRIQLDLLKNVQFDIMLMIGFITTFGYLVPSFLLPSYAEFLGLNPWIGTNLSAIMSAVNVVAKLISGYTSDRIGRINGLVICTLLAGLMSLAVWTNAKTEAAIWVFAVLYGFFGGGHLTLFPASLPQVAGYDNIPAANGLVYFTNTFGYLVGTPIASALINQTNPPNYSNASIWAGVLMLTGGFLALALRVVKAGWHVLTVV
ncbi:major facilitator superfamily domain-containing protein [Radiomyces spectabilis]|uniref:major facilitator superfamily domain-containing protein n=1 Tax=Radiomyces spectabilis TaxID=64574 RepID=UPI00221ECA1E|nr:major facilitator superfamily domain-containing protein [Radiomyces spectabilis]KAI8388862.1 major facilitator superfamily domain-containing protein [Radiomyces spectabilis]